MSRARASTLGLVPAFVAACNLITGASDLDIEASPPASAPDATPAFDAGSAEASPVPDASFDAGEEAGTKGPCDLAKPFDPPVPVPVLNGTSNEEGASLSSDEKLIYFASEREPLSGFDLFVATRMDATAPWSPPTKAVNLSGGSDDLHGSLSGSATAVVFVRAGGSGQNASSLYTSSRASSALPFGAPQLINIDGSQSDSDPFLSADGQVLYFLSNRALSYRIYRAQRGLGNNWQTPAIVNGLPTDAHDPVVSPDELTIIFAVGTGAAADIYTATRPSKSDAFGAMTPLTSVNSPGHDQPDWLSPDGCRLYLTSDRAGTLGQDDLWIATRPK